MADDDRKETALICGKYAFFGFLLLVALGDWLFYGRPGRLGSLPFAVFVPALLIFHFPAKWSSRPAAFRYGLTATAALSVLGMIYEPCFLSGLLCFGSVAALSLGYGFSWNESVSVWVFRWINWAITAPFNWLILPIFARKGKSDAETDAGEKKSRFGMILRQLALWIIPLIFGCFFLLLFSGANPVLERTLTEILKHIELPSLGRICFWIFMTVLIFFFSCKVAVRTGGGVENSFFRMIPVKVSGEGALSRTQAAVALRSLALFNLIFFWQNIYDIEYLWAKFDLPEGIGYAEYAHRGAYVLIFTAMFAGVLAMVFFSGKCAGEDWKWPRRLVCLWIAQNVFLVVSAFLRLVKYVEVYSLTELRVAAGCWMLLVAAGLVLILLYIVRNLSVRFLFWSNAGTLLFLLLVVALLDVNGFIASYNVAHCREVREKTAEGLVCAKLDVGYLENLGSPAWPALLEAEKRGIANVPGLRDEVRKLREDNRGAFHWTLRNELLLRKIERLYPEVLQPSPEKSPVSPEVFQSSPEKSPGNAVSSESSSASTPSAAAPASAAPASSR